MFSSKRYATANIMREVPLELQTFLWECVDSIPIGMDYLQIFRLSKAEELQKIIHEQECPPYQKEYVFAQPFSLTEAKIYVINDEAHATMLFAYEY
jgi:hypothetical protein